MGRPVQSAVGVIAALRDLINKAGDGQLIGGRLEGAIADEPSAVQGANQLVMTLGTTRYRVIVIETSPGNAERDS